MAIRSRRPDASPRVGSHGGARVDLRRFLVADRVLYRDNGRDLDAERLPVPEAGTPLR